MRTILDEYVAIVQANPHVGRRFKLKLRAQVALAQASPPWLIRTYARYAHSRPIRLLRRLWG
jgi:hypothetical protein